MNASPIRVCVAGATGWTGSAVTRALLSSPDFRLTGAIARSSQGADIGTELGLGHVGLPITGTVKESLEQPADVLVDYTSPSSVRARVLEALDLGLHVVIGSSGLTAADFAAIDVRARAMGLGVVAAGNFSLTAALAKHFALLAARYLPSWEIVDYASADKPDAPSGTTLELAEAMAAVAADHIAIPIQQTLGMPEARGATISGSPVHSIRLPGYVIAFETHFGLPDERLSIRHDAGAGAAPYVPGTLLAIKAVMRQTGVVRGLDRILFPDLGKL